MNISLSHLFLLALFMIDAHGLEGEFQEVLVMLMIMITIMIFLDNHLAKEAIKEVLIVTGGFSSKGALSSLEVRERFCPVCL